MAKKTLYYTDPLKDDFAARSRPNTPLRANYTFVQKNPLWRLTSFLIYYVLAVPVGWVIDRVLFGVRVHNRKALRQVKEGFFLYANHTQSFHDAYAPVMAAFPRRCYTQVYDFLCKTTASADNVAWYEYKEASSERKKEGVSTQQD